jgi:hypothetical protein
VKEDRMMAYTSKITAKISINAEGFKTEIQELERKFLDYIREGRMMEDKKIKYQAYLLDLLCMDLEEIIDIDILSFKEFVEKEEV